MPVLGMISLGEVPVRLSKVVVLPTPEGPIRYDLSERRPQFHRNTIPSKFDT